MATPFQAQAYNTFLSVIGKDSPSISHDQLLGGVAYYLTELPHPYIRSFATLTVSSPALWGQTPRSSPFGKIHSSAQGIRQAVHQAVLAKHAALQTDPSKSSIIPALGRQRVALAFAEWLDLLVSGSRPRHLRSGNESDFAVPRLAFLAGLVLGLRDLEKREEQGGVSVQVPHKSVERCCAEVVVSVAECLDQYVPGSESESRSDSVSAWALRVRASEQHLDIIVELCAAVLPAVPAYQLVALDLPKLSCVCSGSVLHVFHNGRCFELLESEMVKLGSGQLGFKPESKFPQEVQTIHSSLVYTHLGPIAKLIGHLFVCMAQSEYWQSRLYPVLVNFVNEFGEASLNLEKSWSRTLFSQVKEDEGLAQEIRPTATNVWHMLKSMLFTTVLVAQSVLDVIIYYSPITPREAKALSRTILMAFCRLSFISTKFGALTAEGGGFSEMKRAFFGALDVLAFNSNDRDRTGDESCIKLIIDLSCELSDIERLLGAKHPIWHGRVAYFLVCTEHVINQLPEETIIGTVLPVVQRHLSDNDNREIYEAAHSVMLAIFATHEAQSHPGTDKPRLPRVHLLVPAYIDILLRNSEQGRLSTDQLRLAFQALVRSASSRSDELGWFCVDQLIAAIEQLEISQADQNEQILRLQLALISTISAVPISKLSSVLGAVREKMFRNKTPRGVLAEAVYREILEHLGDRERDIALKWWLSVKADLQPTQ